MRRPPYRYKELEQQRNTSITDELVVSFAFIGIVFTIIFILSYI